MGDLIHKAISYKCFVSHRPTNPVCKKCENKLFKKGWAIAKTYVVQAPLVNSFPLKRGCSIKATQQVIFSLKRSVFLIPRKIRNDSHSLLTKRLRMLNITRKKWVKRGDKKGMTRNERWHPKSDSGNEVLPNILNATHFGVAFWKLATVTYWKLLCLKVNLLFYFVLSPTLLEKNGGEFRLYHF